MKIKINGLDLWPNEKEGIIYQSNYKAIEEILVSYYPKNYKDEHGCYDDHRTVAKFTIKLKTPSK